MGLCWSFPYLEPTQLGARDRVSVNRAIALDAVYTFAGALAQLIQTRDNVFEPANLWGAVRGVVLPSSATGYLQFDERGDRVGTYSLINLVAPGVKRVVVNDTRPAPPSSSSSNSSSGRASEGVEHAMDRAGPGRRVFEQLQPIVYAGNRATFENKIRYHLQWTLPQLATTTFTSSDEGDPVRPWPQVKVWVTRKRVGGTRGAYV